MGLAGHAEQAAALGWPPVAVWGISALTIPTVPSPTRDCANEISALLSLTRFQVGSGIVFLGSISEKATAPKKDYLFSDSDSRRCSCTRRVSRFNR